MSPQSTARLDADVVGEVRTYSRLSGVPINRVIEDAVEQYLGTVGRARLAGMIAEIKKRGSGWLSEAERELLDREDAAGVINLKDETRGVMFNDGVGGPTAFGAAPLLNEDLVAQVKEQNKSEK
jgi:hypothetical protein